MSRAREGDLSSERLTNEVHQEADERTEEKEIVGERDREADMRPP